MNSFELNVLAKSPHSLLEIIKDFIGHHVELIDVNAGLHTREKVEIGHHQQNADGPKKIHYLGQ